MASLSRWPPLPFHSTLPNTTTCSCMSLPRLSSLQVWEVEVNVPVGVAKVLPVEVVLGALGLVLILKEDKSVSSLSSIVHVDDDVAIRHSKVAEEVSNISDGHREWETSHLEASVPVVCGDMVGKAHSLTTVATAVSATTASVVASSSATSIAGASSTVSTTATTVVAATSVVEFLGLVLLEVGMLVGLDHDELDPPVANVLVVFLGVGIGTVLGALEQNCSLTSQLTVSHLSDLDRVVDKVESIEEVDDVFGVHGEWESLELHGGQGRFVLWV